MADIALKIKTIDWQAVHDSMHAVGYAHIPTFLSKEQCRDLIELYDCEQRFRKTVVMEQYRFGLGSYKYWDYPLPNLVQTLRESLYPCLVPLANAWMKCLQINEHFPTTYKALQAACHNNGQTKPTPLILKYTKGGFNTLHQDLYGEVFFPMQAAIILNKRDRDYSGGEFVLTEQIPRAQSKATVLHPNQGDMIIITTNFRPVKSARGYTRAKMRHGVSPVHSGTRYTMGIIFHDAVS